MLFRRKKPTDSLTAPKGTIPLDLGGLPVRPSPRARRMGLRVEARTGDVVFTWPLKGRISVERALKFIEENRGWIERQQSRKTPAQPFAPGTVLTVAGVPVTIHPAGGRGLTRIEGNVLLVHGQPEHVSRRVKDFLKKEALATLQRLTDEKSVSLKLKPLAIRILDPRSRWGSCGPDGRIMYSWRLILAPVQVMDYVVAHEVAHRIHLNHSRRFWALCASLTADASGSRHWLRQQGRLLMAAG